MVCLGDCLFEARITCLGPVGTPRTKKAPLSENLWNRVRNPTICTTSKPGFTGGAPAIEEATKFKKLWPFSWLRDGCQSVQANSEIDRPTHQLVPTMQGRLETFAHAT